MLHNFLVLNILTIIEYLSRAVSNCTELIRLVCSASGVETRVAQLQFAPLSFLSFVTEAFALFHISVTHGEGFQYEALRSCVPIPSFFLLCPSTSNRTGRTRRAQSPHSLGANSIAVGFIFCHAEVLTYYENGPRANAVN